MTESRKNRVRDILLRSRDDALTQVGRIVREGRPGEREANAEAWLRTALNIATDIDWYDAQVLVEQPDHPEGDKSE